MSKGSFTFAFSFLASFFLGALAFAHYGISRNYVPQPYPKTKNQLAPLASLDPNICYEAANVGYFLVNKNAHTIIVTATDLKADPTLHVPKSSRTLNFVLFNKPKWKIQNPFGTKIGLITTNWGPAATTLQGDIRGVPQKDIAPGDAGASVWSCLRSRLHHTPQDDPFDFTWFVATKSSSTFAEFRAGRAWDPNDVLAIIGSEESNELVIPPIDAGDLAEDAGKKG